MVFVLLIFCISNLLAEPCGDVNSSDGINIVDALLIAQYYVGIIPENIDKVAADVNADNNINIVDALLIAQYYVGLITSLPGCDQTPSPTPPGQPTSPPQVNDCSEAPVWSGDDIYDTAGMRVQYNGNLYENNWYTQNQNPEENSGENEVWTLIGPCDPKITPVPSTPTPTTVPTATPTQTPIVTPTPTPTNPPASGAEVRLEGSSWIAIVNGSTVYSGNRMFDAANACISSIGSGTVNIRNSGDSGPGIGDIYAIKPLSNITLDFHGNTVNCNGDAYIVPVQADKKSNITVRNLRVTGNPRYGIWFRTCTSINFQSITMNLTGGLGIRVDDSKGGWSRDLTADDINITGAGNHGFETYGVDGFSIGTVNATDVAYCGLILNNSRNGTVGTVNGIRCCPDGGYAAFRVANNNGPNVTCDRVYARGCGRGFFSVSGSNGCTVRNVDIADCWSHGIFLEDATNTHVLNGKVSNCNPNCQMVRTTNCTINVSGCN